MDSTVLRSNPPKSRSGGGSSFAHCLNHFSARSTATPLHGDECPESARVVFCRLSTRRRARRSHFAMQSSCFPQLEYDSTTHRTESVRMSRNDASIFTPAPESRTLPLRACLGEGPKAGRGRTPPRHEQMNPLRLLPDLERIGAPPRSVPREVPLQSLVVPVQIFRLLRMADDEVATRLDLVAHQTAEHGLDLGIEFLVVIHPS